MKAVQLQASAARDVQIDWLRGLAMTCVIINHSKLSSPLSWFTYERFWVVTAAEVFVVLSGIVLGMIYRRRLARTGWSSVICALARRAAFLYAAFVAVAVSVLALAAMGIDVTPLSASDGHTPAWFLAPHMMTAAAWRDVLLMRVGPWAFEIIGLYVWLVAAAIPCLLVLHRPGWRALLALSWVLYLWYRIDPHLLTGAGFESSFPILAWQLLFAHGITIGYHRDEISGWFARLPTIVPRAAMAITIGFTTFAFCNPWADGASWLHLRVVSPERFADWYGRYFALSDLGIGRLLNLAIALPVAHAMLTRYWWIARPLEALFVTFGRRSLGAFVLHVYGLLLLAHVSLPHGLWANALVQMAFVLTTATLLSLPKAIARASARLPTATSLTLEWRERHPRSAAIVSS